MSQVKSMERSKSLMILEKNAPIDVIFNNLCPSRNDLGTSETFPEHGENEKTAQSPKQKATRNQIAFRSS